ncbi:MAG TPA: hypothetical protein VMU50_09965 [Polyangia bacterium]|nr:hypothetical protein [Polyangia bacterium]
MGGNDGGSLPTGCDTSGIFSKYTCTTVCHGAAGAPSFGGFDMTAATFPHSLVGGMPAAPTMANMNKCGGMNQVYLKPGVQPAQGLFLDKLKPNPPCGVQMPMGTGMMLTADELTCVQNWANNVVAGGTGK